MTTLFQHDSIIITQLFLLRHNLLTINSFILTVYEQYSYTFLDLS